MKDFTSPESDQQPSTSRNIIQHQILGLTPSTDQQTIPFSVGYMAPHIGRHFQDSISNAHESILREEIEKECIRKEIIAEEVARRRVLELEVRRELTETSSLPPQGDVARVNGQLAVSRAFGDKNLKSHLSSDPDVTNADVDGDTDILILASDGLWKVMSNQEAVDIVRKVKDPHKAAKQLAIEALIRESKDDISCIVVRFKG
nr:probable protein phosphatase 2C 9 [Nicotiana tomentosiformis]